MRQMVGLFQRRGIFYFRRTIPEALRADMPAVLGTAGPGIFDDSAPVSLKGRRAGREFWVSLGTRDEDVARDRARRLDGEADALVRLAKRRLALSAQPKLSDLDDTVLQSLVATFRHRKLAADEARRRGADPLSREGFDALGREIASREAELRDANARGDCTATHFDHDAMMTVLDAGLNIAFGSPADRRLHPMLSRPDRVLWRRWGEGVVRRWAHLGAPAAVRGAFGAHGSRDAAGILGIVAGRPSVGDQGSPVVVVPVDATVTEIR